MSLVCLTTVHVHETRRHLALLAFVGVFVGTVFLQNYGEYTCRIIRIMLWNLLV